MWLENTITQYQERGVRARALLTANLSPDQVKLPDKVQQRLSYFEYSNHDTVFEVIVPGQLSGESYVIGVDHYVNLTTYVLRHNRTLSDSHLAIKLCVSLACGPFDAYPTADAQLAIALRVQHDEVELLRVAGWNHYCPCPDCRSFFTRFRWYFRSGFRSRIFLTAKRLRSLLKKARGIARLSLTRLKGILR